MFIPLKDDNPTHSFPLVTLGIVILNGLIFFHQLNLDPQQSTNFIYQWGAIPYQITHQVVLQIPPLIPIPLTLFSSMFLHGGFLHILGNMLYLWIFGNNIEDTLGHFRFFLFYLLCGLAAGLAQVFAAPQSVIPMIGASGAIAGVLGGYLLLFPTARILTLFFIIIFVKLIHLPAIIVLGFWFFIQLLNVGLKQEGDVAWFAHIGGFVTGLIFVKIFQREPVRGRRR